MASALVVLFLCLSFRHIAGYSAGFSVDLIHRDSPASPFHDPASTPFSRLHAAIHRSAAQANKFGDVAPPNSNSHPVPGAGYSFSAPVTSYDHDYLMKFYIGTPPKLTFAVADTGSELPWVLCFPCPHCYKHIGNLFDIKKSDSYETHPCISDDCNLLKHKPCVHDDSPCEYLRHEYFDNSFVDGILSKETLLFDSPHSRKKVELPGIIFGCTHNTSGDFNYGSVGIVGLNGGNLSLIRQLGPSIGNKFSYCLPSLESTSAAKMYFGTAAIISNPRAVSTPFSFGSDNHVYNINLKLISVVGTTGRIFTINLKRRASRLSNLMMIDSGTYMTYIPEKLMSDLSNKLEEVITNRRARVPKKVAGFMDLCFDWKKPTEMPKITFEFEGNAAVHLVDAFVFVDKVKKGDKKLKCLVISAVRKGGVSTFGSGAQMDYRVVYDLDEKSITFAPEECSPRPPN